MENPRINGVYKHTEIFISERFCDELIADIEPFGELQNVRKRERERERRKRERKRERNREKERGGEIYMER